MLDQEAGLADELARLLGQHPQRAVAPLVGIADILLVLVVVLVVGDDQPLLEDDVEAGLHVVGVLVLVLVLLFLVFAASLGLDGGRAFLLVVFFEVVVLDVVMLEVVVDDGLVVDDLLVVLLEVLEVVSSRSSGRSACSSRSRHPGRQLA